VDLLGYSTFSSKRNGIELDNIQLNFLVQVDACDVKLNRASHSDALWISLDDAGNEIIDPFTKSIMTSARLRYKQTGMSKLVNR
jgi:hypothetical protein